MTIYDPEKYSEILHTIDTISIFTNNAISALMAYLFLRFFTEKKATALIGAMAFQIPVAIWTFFPYESELLRVVFIFIYIACSFGAMYAYERVRPKQKLLAVMMIYTFSGLARVFTSEINTPIINYVYSDPDLNRLEWLLPEYIGIDLIEHILFASYYLLLIILYHKSYGQKEYEPDINGFFILSIPAVAHYISRKLYRENYATYVEYYNSLIELDDIDTLQNLSWGSYTRIVETIISSVFLLAIVYLYRKSQKTSEEKTRERLLEMQMSETRERLTRIDAIYNDMRSMKHDMRHQIRVLSDLVENGHIDEAAQGLEKLEAQTSAVLDDVATGNPVTDVLLMDFKREAQSLGIGFDIDFSFSKDAGIDVFDICMILSNAISNAFNASADLPEAVIFVGGKPKQNMFLITVKNTFFGDLPKALSNVEETIEKTSSAGEKAKELHGYGISNMKRITQKYYGDISYEKVDDMIIFTAMLQMR